ncbi:COX assembly mitochondrial protein homolog, partial [Notothenia coriiceps]|uniref:COX assembly mitochondrial protein n=1 Tax=Notothenia coriiceps TaxID=8208 RepID=A0A6I9MVG7_9TELE
NNRNNNSYLCGYCTCCSSANSPSFCHLPPAFNHCCKDSGFLMVLKCREQNAALKECLTIHYKDPAFFEQCKQEYIKEKIEFLTTGVAAKNRKQKLPTSM